MGQPITTNPILIAAINITVVFCVLYGLSLLIRLITLIDPTRKKEVPTIVTPESLKQVSVVADTATIDQENYDEMIILFTAAIAAYGHSGVKIVAIRPIVSSTWSQAAHIKSISDRNGIF